MRSKLLGHLLRNLNSPLDLYTGTSVQYMQEMPLVVALLYIL